jgi:sugar lactone lactonase YvrE
VVGGLTAVIDVAFDRHGRLYALEMGNGRGSGFPEPGAGRVVRVSPHGDHQVVATGLTFPTAMTFGPDGRLYVSNRGFDAPPTGTGEIVTVDVR